ncbi:MAG: hypothetical protein ACLSGF_00220 [Alistipes onderdonkii]
MSLKISPPTDFARSRLLVEGPEQIAFDGDVAFVGMARNLFFLVRVDEDRREIGAAVCAVEKPVVADRHVAHGSRFVPVVHVPLEQNGGHHGREGVALDDDFPGRADQNASRPVVAHDVVPEDQFRVPRHVFQPVADRESAFDGSGERQPDVMGVDAFRFFHPQGVFRKQGLRVHDVDFVALSGKLIPGLLGWLMRAMT